MLLSVLLWVDGSVWLQQHSVCVRKHLGANHTFQVSSILAKSEDVAFSMWTSDPDLILVSLAVAFQEMSFIYVILVHKFSFPVKCASANLCKASIPTSLLKMLL